VRLLAVIVHAGTLIRVQLGSKYPLLFQLIGLLMLSNIGALMITYSNQR
jgi:hypothetical protein